MAGSRPHRYAARHEQSGVADPGEARARSARRRSLRVPRQARPPDQADGRLAIDNNAAERALRGIAITRKNFLFLGSDAGGERAAILYTVLETAKLNGLDPEAYLADVIDGMARGHPINRLGELLPWNWQRRTARMAA